MLLEESYLREYAMQEGSVRMRFLSFAFIHLCNAAVYAFYVCFLFYAAGALLLPTTYIRG